jgi:hypothetical protein
MCELVWLLLVARCEVGDDALREGGLSLAFIPNTVSHGEV